LSRGPAAALTVPRRVQRRARAPARRLGALSRPLHLGNLEARGVLDVVGVGGVQGVVHGRGACPRGAPRLARPFARAPPLNPQPGLVLAVVAGVDLQCIAPPHPPNAFLASAPQRLSPTAFPTAFPNGFVAGR
jgi:hypothetical protein